MGATVQERLTELEVKLAYQEQTIEDLNQALVTQEMALQKLERVCAELVRRVDSMRAAGEAGASPSAEDERPPHY